MSFEADVREFARVFDSYIPTTKKTASEALNDRARNIAYKAAAATPIESPAAIASDLRRDPKLLARLVSIKLRRRGKVKLQPGEFRAMMDSLVRQRQATSRYLRSGWAQIIIDLGGSFRGSRKKPSAARRTTHSYGHKATILSLLAELGWQADEPTARKVAGAESQAQRALTAGLRGETEALAKHVEDKLARAFR